MILFKSVSYKNFLDSCNNPIKVNLDSHGTTLIVGQNGAGKSTIIEAVIFALFNMLPAFPLDGGLILKAIVRQVTGS